MKYFLPLLLMALQAHAASLTMTAALQGGVASVGGCPSTATEDNTGSLTDLTFVGFGVTGDPDAYSAISQKWWTPSRDGTLCADALVVWDVIGDVSTNYYEARIYLTNLCTMGTTCIATSTPVLGTNAWSATLVKFTYSTTPAIYASNVYNRVFRRVDGGVSFPTGYFRAAGNNTSTQSGVSQGFNEAGNPSNGNCVGTNSFDLATAVFY